MNSGKWHEVVLTGEANRIACRHLLQHYQKGERQEDLCFGLWTPSHGSERETAIVTEILLPGRGERDLHGNASFGGSYLARATRQAIRNGQGLAFMHSHPSSGWQNMSVADVRAERDRIADTARATGRPLVGMAAGTDGHWSARVWNEGTKRKTRCWSRAGPRAAGARAAPTCGWRAIIRSRIAPAPARARAARRASAVGTPRAASAAGRRSARSRARASRVRARASGRSAGTGSGRRRSRAATRRRSASGARRARLRTAARSARPRAPPRTRRVAGRRGAASRIASRCPLLPALPPPS